MSGTGYILNGKYYKASEPIEATAIRQQPLLKSYELDRSKERFRRDFIQPRTNGRPNPDFVKAYPEESKRYFSQEELNEMERP